MERPARLRAVEALRKHAPELAEAVVTELGSGLDHAVFVAGDLVLRVGHGRRLVAESRLLQVVAERVSVPVPAVRFVDEDRGVLAYPLLRGRPLLGRVPHAGTAAVLGRFLRDLHGIDPATVSGLVPTEEADPAAWLEDLEGPVEFLRLLSATVPPPSHRRVLTHSDLGAEHLLVVEDEDDEEDGGRLTGVLDWSDAALADPVLDFARLYRDFGPVFLARTLDAYGDIGDPSAARARIEFFARCAALEDLAYGRSSGRAEYTHAAERSISWLFPPSR